MQQTDATTEADGSRAAAAAVPAVTAATSQSRGRYFVGTINNPPSDRSLARIMELAGFSADATGVIRFWVGQLERGDAGTPHWQFYFQTATPRGLRAAVGFFGDLHPHLEFRRGSHEQAVAYCSKEDTRVSGPWTAGVAESQGKRNDLGDIGKQLVDGTITLRQVAESNPEFIIKHGRGLSDIAGYRKPAKRDAVAVICIVGPTGIGKTHWIFEDFGEVLYQPVYGNGGVWFNKYAGERVLLLDEFRSQMPLQQLLRVLDKFKYTLDAKFGESAAAWTLVFVVSNSAPDRWYEQSKRGPDGQTVVYREEEVRALFSRLGIGNERRAFSKFIDCFSLGIYGDSRETFFAVYDAALREVAGRTVDGISGSSLFPAPPRFSAGSGDGGVPAAGAPAAAAAGPTGGAGTPYGNSSPVFRTAGDDDAIDLRRSGPSIQQSGDALGIRDGNGRTNSVEQPQGLGGMGRSGSMRPPVQDDFRAFGHAPSVTDENSPPANKRTHGEI